jgi:hypothetical protein
MAVFIPQSVSTPNHYTHSLNATDLYFVPFSYIILREPGKTPILPFSQCLIALRFSSGDQTYDLLDIECLLVSLLDQV